MKKKYSNYYKTIGDNLKKRRLQLGLSQQKLADKIPKMDRSKISDMENGKEDFYFSTLLNICEALEIDVEEVTKMKSN